MKKVIRELNSSLFYAFFIVSMSGKRDYKVSENIRACKTDKAVKTLSLLDTLRQTLRIR